MKTLSPLFQEQYKDEIVLKLQNYFSHSGVKCWSIWKATFGIFLNLFIPAVYLSILQFRAIPYHLLLLLLLLLFCTSLRCKKVLSLSFHLAGSLKYIFYIQALHICESHVHRFNQPRIKNSQKQIACGLKMHRLFFVIIL